jgi:4-amino-4-deoxy-L-arabinose transferase-like glycosyltransferase
MPIGEEYRDTGSNRWDRRDTLLVAVLVLMCAAMFLPGGFFRDLWPPDEPRYAQVAREMAETGQWIVPHLNYETYAHKPPLFFWLVALSAKLLGGFSTIAAVLPSALAGIGTVLLSYLLARNMFKSRLTGFLGGVVLATSVEFLGLSSIGRMDIPLTFFTTLALFHFWRWHVEGRRAYLFPFYIGMAFAVLVKGPVGLLPLPIALIYLVASKQAAKIGKMHLGLGLLGTAAIIACWLVPAAIVGGEAYWQELLGKQIFGRVYKSWSHGAPFYYYMISFPWGFLPWFALLPAAIIRYARERTERTGSGITFVVTWFLTIFIFFTLISGKRDVYLLPLFPACALFLAKYLADVVVSGERKPVELKVCFTLLFVVLLGIGVAAVVAPIPYRTPESQKLFFMVSAYVAAVGVSGLISLRAKTLKPALIVASCFMIGMTLVGNPFVVPFVNTHKSAEPLGRKILEVRRGPEQIGMYGFYRAEFSFYTRSRIEPIEGADNLYRFLEQPGGAFCIVQERDFKPVEGGLPEGTESLGTFNVGSRRLVVLYNPPDGADSDSVEAAGQVSTLTPNLRARTVRLLADEGE